MSHTSRKLFEDFPVSIPSFGWKQLMHIIYKGPANSQGGSWGLEERRAVFSLISVVVLLGSGSSCSEDCMEAKL